MTTDVTTFEADEQGWFGDFGGRFMPEALVAALDELTAAWREAMADPAFVLEFETISREYAGTPSPLYDAQRLTQGLRRLVDELGLDILMIDTHPGLGEETLLSLVISHTLLIVMRPDQQDYEGTGITVKVAQSLHVPRMLLMVNKAPPILAPEAVEAKVEQAYGCKVAAVLPHSDEMMNLASAGIFALRYPGHPLTSLYRQVAAELMR